MVTYVVCDALCDLVALSCAFNTSVVNSAILSVAGNLTLDSIFFALFLSAVGCSNRWAAFEYHDNATASRLVP